MRKRKYVVGATLALAASVAVAAIAQAAVVSQTLTVKSNLTKQSKKTPGPSDLDVNIATTETPPTPDAQSASHTDVDFDKDFVFTPGTLKQCNPAALVGTSTDGAKAACPGSQVGSGDATICSSAAGCGAISAPVVVTAFNGVPVGGNPTFILHAKGAGVAANAAPLVLIGTLIRSPLGGQYGMRLSVEVPAPPAGFHLTNFHTVVPKTLSQKGKKTKKGKKPPKYYISARCSGDRVWQFQETTMFRGGAPNQTATATVPCSQKKEPKKK